MQFFIDIALSLIYFALFLLICAWSWRFWMMYINQRHLNGLKWVMLEIKLPREIFKSPLATETALLSLIQGGGVGTKFHRLYQGALPAFSSIEIASLEGIIHFYVRIQTKFRPYVEANFYAQYPGIEIVEVDDYTKQIRYHHLTKEVSMWGTRYSLSKTWEPINPETGEGYKHNGKSVKMKADFLPLKTYVDYKLDGDPKEEFKIDPLTPLLEVMGGIGKGEYFWYQIIVQDEGVYNGTSKLPKFYVNPATHEHFTLEEMADKRKAQLRSGKPIPQGTKAFDDFGYPRMRKGADGTDEQVVYQKLVLPTKKEQDLTLDDKEEIDGINKKFTKPLIMGVIRLVYISKKESFRTENIQSVINFPKPFNGVNALAPTKNTDPYDFPWQNAKGRRVPWRAEEMFEEYVEREGFFPHIKPRPWLDKWEDSWFWGSSMKTRRIFRMLYEGFFDPFGHPAATDPITLNVEELATLWHLPGAVATTPAIPRIDSTKGFAPVNLPQ